MFPEHFVQKHLFAFTDPGDLVYDPFSGRGTTVFESLLQDRLAAGSDVNKVAVCLSNAKADPPGLNSTLARISELEPELYCQHDDSLFEDPFFKLCFNRNTLKCLLYLRSALDWRDRQEDRFIAAIVLGSLQGDPSRTRYCFSNRMPRTISTKPQYSVQWWRQRNLRPPERDVFDILRYMVQYRFYSKPASRRGVVAECDARDSASVFPGLANKVKLILTSPPYFDTTHYQEDQWLRLWFLGGQPRPARCGGDDRHRSQEKYWKFLTESWQGVRGLLATNAAIVVRIGSKNVNKEELLKRLFSSLEEGLDTKVTLMGKGNTSRISRRQTNSFRPGAVGTKFEHDFCFKLA